MSNSTTLMDTISTAQSNKEAVVNALVDALSPAALWGRHASACNLLVWGYYGGTYYTTSAANAIANGTVTLTASTTNYLYANATTGAVSVNTTGFPAGSVPLYTVVTNSTTVTSYTDERSYQPSAIGGGGDSGTVTSVAGAGGVESATGAITGSGTLRETMLLAGGAVQTAAYSFVTGDRASTLVMNSASAVSQGLPSPTGSTLTTNFPKGWGVWIENIGAGVTTVSAASGISVDGVVNGTVTLAQNTGIGVFTDGTNYFTLRGAAAGGGGGFTNPMTTTGDMIVGGTSGTALRLPVGSAGQVLGVSGGSPAWTGPLTGAQFFNFIPSGGPTSSSSAFAWKGNVFGCSAACLIPAAQATALDTVSGNVYQACVVQVNPTTLALSGTPVFSTPITATSTASAAQLNFVFPTPAALVAGNSYAIMVGCTNQGATYALPEYGYTNWPNTPYLNMNTIIRLAQVTPANGQTYDHGSPTTTPNGVSVTVEITTAGSTTPCSFQAQNTTSQAIPASSATVLTGWTAVQDNSGGAMNYSTGVFTAPYNGWYQVSGSVLLASAAFAASNVVEAVLSVAGTAVAQQRYTAQTAITAPLSSGTVASVIYLTAGQTLTFSCLQNTSASINLAGSAIGTFFSVAFLSAGVNAVQSTAPIALTTYYPGTPSASANLLRAVVPVACTFPASLTGSKAVCDAAPTSAVTCNITHNGTVVGSVNFAASATSGTFTFSSAVNNAAGDVWAVVAPASPDATFAGPAIALLASAPAAASNTTLASMGDVDITSPVDGQMLVYSGALGQWVNTAEDDGSGFVDGNFDFWDVATSVAVSTSDVFVSDMWVGNSGTGGAATVSQVTRTLGSEPSYMMCPNKYQLQWAQTTAASASPTIGEKLEGVGTYNGRTITVQASLVAAAAGVDVIGIRATQYFGTGGSPSASVVTTQTVAWSVTTTEQKFSDTIAIPSITGKTLGTSGTDYLRIDLLMATGTTFTLKYSQLQIDPSPAGFNATNVGTGGVPKAFRYRGQSLERARVSRYLWAIAYDPAGAGVFCSVGFTNASTNLLSVFPLPGMRTGPTLLFGTGSASAMSISNPVGQAVTAVAFTAGNPYSVELNATFATAATVGVSAALRTPGTGTPVTLFADARLTV